jgi:signal transduction histidine kinase
VPVDLDAEQAKLRAWLQEGMHAARMVVWEWEPVTGRARFSENATDVLGCCTSHMDTVWAAIDKEDWPKLQAAYRRAIGDSGGYHELVRFHRPDNGQLLWLDVRGKVRRNQSGAALAMRGVTVDVTERMQAQAELARVNQALAGQLDRLARAEARQAFQLRVADLLRALSAPGLIFAATCELLGQYLRAPRVLCGDYDAERHTVTYHSCYADGVAVLEGTYPVASFGSDNFASLESGATWICHDFAGDARTNQPDREPTFTALQIASAVVVPLSRNGALISCLFVNDRVARVWSADDVLLIEDVAGRIWSAIERVRAEAALRQADLRKNEFLAMLAHELRNPLAPISAAAEILKHCSENPARVRSISAVLGRQTGHMTALVDDLLDVSRVTSGLVVLASEEAELASVVRDAAEQARPLLETRGHHFCVELPEQVLRVRGDHKRLVQVLANLINNAAKYTPDGGNISLQVSLLAGQRQVQMVVSDNGIGMAPSLLPRVFELFSQAKRTPDRTQGGLGLGLALVKNLVELHGGSVAAHSAGEHLGSEFIVRLPLLAHGGQ